ncbi:MAG: HDOD domain-containing protein [Oscillospiraceae bacterium]|nr:HDOD domain-containing protein [Oscillospiraceae bacterium]MCL2279186.1 HDOD domain-containing protein [Oscillospiraceae bacterium]
MRFFISAVPFFDANMSVHAYKMMTHDGDKLLGTAEDHRMLGGELMAPALDFVKEIGTEPFAGEADLFVDISKYQLLIGMPLTLGIPPENFVCVVKKEALEDNATSARLGRLKRKGYKIAVEGYPRTMSMDTAVKVFDYMLLSCNHKEFQKELKEIRPYIFKIRLVITEVPDMDSFNKYSGARGVLLSGNFYSQPITKGKVEISPLKINALNLLGQINDDSFELGEAAATIERDPALSISLLRFLNSMNPDRSRKIDSIRNAVAILGQKEVKKWASIAISIGMGEDRPSEITRLSLLRAKFAENLAPAFEMAIKSGSLFISGLFSLLDVILQMPLEKAIDEVAASGEIRDTLLERKGALSEVMRLIFAYENADWHNTSLLMVKNGIDINTLTKAYIDSLYWYRQLLDTIEGEEEPEYEEKAILQEDEGE